MHRSLLLAILFVVALVVATVVVGAARMASARGECADAVSRYDAAQQQALRVTQLRGQSRTAGLERRTVEAVLPQINLVLADAGIPTTQLRNVAPESDAEIAGQLGSGPGRYRRQSVRVNVSNLTTHEIGLFLRSWRTVAGEWTPGRIELTHTTDRRALDRYDVGLLVSTVYYQDGETT